MNIKEMADLKAKCLELTKEQSANTDNWIKEADKLFKFITSA